MMVLSLLSLRNERRVVRDLRETGGMRKQLSGGDRGSQPLQTGFHSVRTDDQVRLGNAGTKRPTGSSSETLPSSTNVKTRRGGNWLRHGCKRKQRFRSYRIVRVCVPSKVFCDTSPSFQTAALTPGGPWG